MLDFAGGSRGGGAQNQVDTLDFAGGGGGGGRRESHPRNRADAVDFAGAGDGGGEKGVTNPEIRYERARFREVVVAEGSRVVYGTLAQYEPPCSAMVVSIIKYFS